MKTRPTLFGVLLGTALALAAAQPALAAKCLPIHNSDNCEPSPGPGPNPGPNPPPPNSPDLVSSVTITSTGGGFLAVTGRVTNKGGTSASGYTVEVTTSARGAEATYPLPFHTEQVPGPNLAPGASYTFPAGQIDSVPPGHRARVCVNADIHNVVPEVNEGNNKACSAVLVPPNGPVTL